MYCVGVDKVKVLELKNVTKQINGKAILKGINFDVSQGEIVGFLGPNGAGKTTTIKLILGILKPGGGEILINNKNIKNKNTLINEFKNISSIVEAPALYEYLSGYENLKQIARLDKRISNEDIDKTIETLDLKFSIYNKVKTYSLGMKQRLAIAMALITKPKLLILDEPTNGLDPSGIIEVRELLKKVVQVNGVSILISSHILGELEHLCDRVVFINNGKIVRNEKLTEIEESKFIIVPKKCDECMKILKGMPFVHSFSLVQNKILVIADSDCAHMILHELAKNNVDIEEMYRYHQTLEEKYREVYNK